ncbi:MAG: UDP-N-acetylglucosamine 1-carboxyvinyltransferase [Bacteroidaceae bacterium]|nr:UDP-N-acetylglucosamine 1-carboxyvinyltransferase [Bacteroidaceae bacterium]
MASFIIEGGHKLQGEITPQGAKNEALEVICATLLTNEPVRISNVPEILDVLHLIELIGNLGVEVTRNGKGDFTFRAANINPDYARSEEFMHKCAALRGSIMLVGPLLARFGMAVLAKPGGDKIGRRKVDTHLYGMQQLGATLQSDNENSRYTLTAPCLKAADMILDEASVTGTANIIMAAVLAAGTTTIYNAACEPYVQQLCRMLNKMGAKISGISSNLLTIEGVSSLHGTNHKVSADMIEVGSFIGMSVMLGGGLKICDVNLKELGNIPKSFQRLGIQLEYGPDYIIVPEQQHYQIETFLDGSFMTIDDSPWPGLTPDLLSVLIVVATQAKGTVLFHQKMFESRLFFVDRLIDMGAQIILCDPHRAVVVGHDNNLKLRARRMTSPDIRAGIALLIAAMSAEGTSQIDNIEQIDRGYEDIEVRLNALGAKITRV